VCHPPRLDTGSGLSWAEALDRGGGTGGTA
jgi:hypothetical protein